MPHNVDDSALVPKPPPPRPAARDAAIEAAKRRFDGEAPAPAPAKPRSPWMGRPQLAWAMTACLVAVIGLPTAFIVMRDGNSPVFQAPPSPSPAPSQEGQVQNAIGEEASPVQSPATPVVRAPAVIPPAQKEEERTAVADNKPTDKLAAAEPPTMAYAAAPPPPPPPPPAAPMVTEKSAGGAMSQDLIVTGSRIRSPTLDRKEIVANRGEISDESSAPDWALKDPSYATFLKRLKKAVRENDRNGVIKLIRFPLRVNSNGRSRVYHDAASVRTDYDKIFTPKVTQAILGQRLERLFGRDQGLMIGNGQVWFDHICTNPQCSPPGPVRIKAVNP